MRVDADRYQQLLDALEPKVRKAFLDAMRRVKDGAVLREVIEAIGRGDAEEVAGLLRLDQATLAGLEDAIEETFRTGVSFQASVGAFYPRHARALEWVRQAGAQLVVEIAQAQREAIRATIEAGIDAGRGQDAVARDIIGVTNRATGHREGGVIGLTGQEAGWVANARRELEAGDPAYLRREARDRRYDPAVRKALKGGKKLDRDAVDRIVRRYSDGLLQRRGQRIARTETLGALNAGRAEGVRQEVEKLGIPAHAVVTRWQSVKDGRTRDTHRAMDGQEGRLDGFFTSPSGALLRYPGDRTLGAPAAEIVHCRCGVSFDIPRNWNERPR